MKVSVCCGVEMKEGFENICPNCGAPAEFIQSCCYTCPCEHNGRCDDFDCDPCNEVTECEIKRDEKD